MSKTGSYVCTCEVSATETWLPVARHPGLSWRECKAGCFMEQVKSLSFCQTGKSKTRILQKFKSLEIHKRRKPLEEVAREINPIIRGIINYYHKFWDGHMRNVWNQLNHRLLKWVKWEKGLYKYASVKWLKQKYKDNPHLFLHWQLVHP